MKLKEQNNFKLYNENFANTQISNIQVSSCHKPSSKWRTGTDLDIKKVLCNDGII